MRYGWPGGQQCAVALSFDVDAESAFVFRSPEKAVRSLAGMPGMSPFWVPVAPLGAAEIARHEALPGLEGAGRIRSRMRSAPPFPGRITSVGASTR